MTWLAHSLPPRDRPDPPERPMKSPGRRRRLYRFVITSPDALSLCYSWIGGPLRPSGKHHVWLTDHNGCPVTRVLRCQVQRTTADEIANRMQADAQARRKN